MKQFINLTKLFITIILILTLTTTKAQKPEFTHYSINEGLSSSVVNCIFQDSNGFMWFGTQDGLNLFDGYKFKHYKNNPLDSLSLSDNWIYGITEDKNKNLWIATRAGVHKLDRKNETFHLFKNGDEKIAYDVLTDKDGDIIVNSLPYILHINPITNSYHEIKIDFESSLQVGDQTQPIYQDRNGFIWIGDKLGLIKYNKTDGSYEIFKQNRNKLNSLNSNYITAFFQDNSDRLWIGTQKGINIYDSDKNNFYKPHIENSKVEIENLFIRSIFQDNQNNIWISTEGDGILRLTIDNETNSFKSLEKYTNNLNDPNSIGNNIVLDIYQDQSDVLWLATLAGVDKTDLKDKKFKLYRKSTTANSIDLLDNVIASIYKDIDGKIWVGNWGSGLNIINRKTNEVEHYSEKFSKNNISNDFVHVIFKDSHDNIWIGTRDGIDIYNRKDKKFYPIKLFFNSENIPDFSNNRIFCIIEDNNNQIWIGTRDGLFILNFEKQNYTHFSTDVLGGNYLSDNLVYDLLQDKDGFIWIGTNNGLDLYNPLKKNIKHIKRDETKTNTLCDNFIVSLCEDSNGDIWIGTKSGVNQFNKKDSTYNYFSEENGLPSNVVYEILLDDNNDLWFGTGKGLTTYNMETKSFKTFDLEDGLQSLEFNLNAKFKAEDGEIFFGGMNGFNSFFPNSLSLNDNIPSIAITSFEKENKIGKQKLNIYKQEEIHLNYDDYAFTIEFASLDFTNSQKNIYKYIVEELMDKWVEIGSRRFVAISNISPGEYTFKVTGTNNDGVWNEEGIELKIIIHPPWWKTKVAYISYLLTLAVLIVFYIKYREKKLLEEKKILENKVKERTYEINQQKEEIQNSYKNVKELSEIGKKITSVLSIESIINIAYDNISQLMHVDLFSIGFYKEKSGLLEFPFTKENGKINSFMSIPINGKNYPASFCLKNNQEIRINSYDEYLKFTNETVPIGKMANSAIYIPLLRNNESFGVLTVQSNNENAYSDYHISILRNIGVYTSIALENADALTEIENQKEEIETQRDEIQTQRDYATAQRDKIAKQNKDITNSIVYAKRIQSAVLPSDDFLTKAIPNHFVYFQPRDIVSGDFYWAHQVDNKTYIAVADCTGHGVPGAFVSLLGISFLNEIIQSPNNSAAEILEKLRNRIKTALNQSDDINDTKDGMDIAFCILDAKNNSVEFSGAYNPLIIIRDQEIIKINGDKMPIGIHAREKDFTNHNIKLEPNDMLYMYSDGFQDQFGGNDGSKYLRSNFENLLISICNMNMDEQKEYLDKEFQNWKGDTNQIDDVLIVGLKL